MGKPHVPVTAAAIISTCLQNNWDIHVQHAPDLLTLTVSDGQDRIEGEWNKRPGLDGSNRETTKYSLVNLVRVLRQPPRRIGISLTTAHEVISTQH